MHSPCGSAYTYVGILPGKINSLVAISKQMSEQIKTEKVKNLQVGANIWAGLDTFLSGSLHFSDYPMNPEQLALNMIEGKVEKKLKRSFDVIFPSISNKRISMSHSDIVQNPNTFVDKDDLPEKSVIVRYEHVDIDPLVTLAPKILSSESSDAERISVLERRDKEYRRLLNQNHSEMLAFKLNEVQVVDLSAANLPQVFSISIMSRTDLKKMSWNEKIQLENLRDDLNVRLSVSTSTWNNIEMFKSFQVDLIEQLSKVIGKRKKSYEAQINVAANFVQQFFIPSLRLTGLFVEKPSKAVYSGTGGQVLHHFVGNVEGLKMLGIVSSNHPKWANPYVKVEYFSEEEASLAPYYDKLRSKHSGVLPFHIDPFSLSADDFLVHNEKVKLELGENYNFNCSAYKVRHDIHVGRLKAKTDSELRNFGVKKWVLVCEDEVGIQIVRPLEGSQTCHIYVFGATDSASFTGAIDLETGLVGEALKDV